MPEDRIAALETQVARLEERMKTMQAEYKTDMALLAKQIGDQLTEQEIRNTERSERTTERWAQRETANIRWIIGTIAVAAGLIIAAIKFL